MVPILTCSTLIDYWRDSRKINHVKPVDAPGFIEFITELIISNKIINLSVRGKKDFLEKNSKIFILIGTAENVDRYQ